MVQENIRRRTHTKENLVFCFTEWNALKTSCKRKKFQGCSCWCLTKQPGSKRAWSNPPKTVHLSHSTYSTPFAFRQDILKNCSKAVTWGCSQSLNGKLNGWIGNMPPMSKKNCYTLNIPLYGFQSKHTLIRFLDWVWLSIKTYISVSKIPLRFKNVSYTNLNTKLCSLSTPMHIFSILRQSWLITASFSASINRTNCSIWLDCTTLGVMFSLKAHRDPTCNLDNMTIKFTPGHERGENKLLQAHKVFTGSNWAACEI